jgi:3-dehydroquinate synthase
MQRLKINTNSGRSLIITGGDLNDLPAFLPSDSRIFIITDTNVRGFYGDRFPAAEVLTVQPGEESKTLTVIGDLCSRLIEAGADRSAFILGFGGGVVCDLAGMVASVYMRGVRHGFVSTTLLSQVDASTGGKTGVNLGAYKNIIGTFRQPEFVLCDHRVLSTLPDEEFQSGVGELIKNAIIRNRDLFFDISSALDSIYDRDPLILEDLIYRAVKIKAGIVRHDPLEKGMRRLLNFGHTFGHVLETAYNLPHGIAVMEGMLIASRLSVWSNELPVAELRIFEKVLEKAGFSEEHVLPDNAVSMISKDKKSQGGSVSFVLLRSVGKAVIRKLPVSEIEAFVSFYREDKKEIKQK